MAVYKCKMCGASLEVSENQTITTCEFCGTCQTVHSFDDEKKVTFFRRANALRYKNEFDKASGVYETLVTEFPKEAEAYWGLVLCKYGIEYVDDPKTGKKIPTCHRTLLNSIFEDVDYLNAIKFADSIAKEVYEKEASLIAEVQKGIINISSKEDPFDVFICYKETESNGERTKDSVIAQDIYKELTNEGYKVFFSRITLEDKLGTEYEPYIFAALHSSKVMIHVTTSSEHSDSIWVRNEWTRYISLINQGEKKVLVPCYAGMDAYDLPDEMQNLQGQDMSKIGAIQDLVRGVSKLLGKSQNAKKVSKVTTEEELYEEKLNIAKIFLNKGLYSEAFESYEASEKLSENCGEALIGMMLAEAKCKTVDEFYSCNNFVNVARKYVHKAENKLEDKKVSEILKTIKDKIHAIDEEEFLNELDQKFRGEKYQNILAMLQTEEKYDENKIKECVYNYCSIRALALFNENDLKCSELILKLFEYLGDYEKSLARKTTFLEKKQKMIKQYNNQIIGNFKRNLPENYSYNSLRNIIFGYKSNCLQIKKIQFYDDELEPKLLEIMEEQKKYICDKSVDFANSSKKIGQISDIYTRICGINLREIAAKIRSIIVKKKQQKRKTKIIIFSIIGVVAVVAIVLAICLANI